MSNAYEKERNGGTFRIVSCVEPGSAADEGGILPGDELIAVNGKKIKDVFDYRYYCADEKVELHMRAADGDEYYVDIEKELYEDIGIEFENPLLDCDRSCANKCVFCFIDQMPPGMRDSLYFKDDDIRLSFLTGNYVTLTNISMHELRRIVKYHMSPINVSVHTVNPELRCKMLNHAGAGNILEKMRILTEGGITVNGQIVLCPGYNDGDELRRTIGELMLLGENVASVSVVPVGLTKYREGLAELRIFTSEECGEIVDIIEAFQKKALSERGRRFVFASDEIYIKAGRKIPSHECYDGFPQIENGVGMVSLLEYELNEYLKSSEGQKKLKKACRALKGRRRIITIAVGVCAYEHIKEMAERVSAACEALGGNINVNVIKIINNFFGENVTVSGLITGGDLIKQLRDRELGENLLITSNMLRNGERIFLDDVTVDELESELKIKVVPVADSGSDFAESIAGISD